MKQRRIIKPGALVRISSAGCNLWGDRSLNHVENESQHFVKPNTIMIIISVIPENMRQHVSQREASVFCLSNTGHFGWTWPYHITVIK